MTRPFEWRLASCLSLALGGSCAPIRDAMPAGPPPGGDLPAIVDRYFDTFNRHDADALGLFYAEEAVLEVPESEVPLRGRKAIVDHLKGLFASVPDVKDHVLNVVSQSDKVAVEFVSTGTLRGSAGKSFRLRLVSVLEFRSGKIVRDATYFDRAALR